MVTKLPHLEQKRINKLLLRIEQKVEDLQVIKLKITAKTEALQRLLCQRIIKAIAYNNFTPEKEELLTYYFYNRVVDAKSQHLARL